MNKTVKNILKSLLFLIVGSVILYIVYIRNQNAYLAECALNNIPEDQCNLLDKITDDIRGANYSWVVLALIIYMVSNVLRALRWNMLLQPLGYTPRFFNSFGAIMVGYLANLGIPRSGEFVRAGLLAKYEDYEAEKVMGTIVTDRILDFICLLIIVGLALILSFNDFMTFNNNLLKNNP